MLISIHAQNLETEFRKLNNSKKIDFLMEVSEDPTTNKIQVLKILDEWISKNPDTKSNIPVLEKGIHIAEQLDMWVEAVEYLDRSIEIANANKQAIVARKLWIKKGEILGKNGLHVHAMEALQLASKGLSEKDQPRLIADAFIQASVIQSNQNNQQEAFKWLEKLKSIASNNNHQDNSLLGEIAYQQAWVRLRLALPESQSMNTESYLIKPKNKAHISNVNSITSWIDQSINHYQKVKDSISEAQCLRLKGTISLLNADFNRARGLYQQALQLYSNPKADSNYLFLLTDLAIVQAMTEDFENAHRSIDSAIAAANHTQKPFALKIKSIIALAEYNDGLAQKNLNQAIRIAESNHQYQQLSDLYALISRVLLNLGEFDKSLDAMSKSSDYDVQIAQIKSRYIDSEQKQKISQISRKLSHQLKRQRNEMGTEIQSLQNQNQTYLYIIGVLLIIILLGILLIFFISRRKKAAPTPESSRETTQVDINQIFKSLAHEIRTPMNGIVGSIPLLKDTVLTPVQDNCVNIIDISSRSILTLVNDISDFSKLDRGVLKIANKSFDLIRTAESVVQIFQKDTQNTNVQLICEVPSNPIPILSGDSDRIQQILMTLISRSFQKTYDGFIRLKIESKIPQGKSNIDICITIEDTGERTRDENLDHIFELSPNITNINNTRRPSSILGMSITKKLVDAMKGTINISPKESGGIIINIHLPFSLHPRLNHWQIPTPYERFEGKRSLMVCPDKFQQETYGAHLQAWGIQAEYVKDITQAINSIHQNPAYDVILFDTNDDVSDLNLLEKISAIRNCNESAEVPIILLNNIEGGISRELKNQKYIHFISKLIRIDEFHACIKQSILFKSPLSSSFASLTPEPKRMDELGEEYPLDPEGDFHFIPYILPFKSKTKINEHLKILLAEDNIVNQKVTSLMLKKMGFQIDIVNNGKEAVEAVETGKYQVVLMDKLMPVMDGLEATMNIRKLNKIEQPIIIALTASASMDDEIACRKAAMDNFLAKPVQFEKMKAGLAFATNVLSNRSQLPKK